MASLTIPSSRIILDPKVIFTVDPITGSADVEVTETCPSCFGYGSPCGQCQGDGERHHKGLSAANLVSLLGADATKAVIATLNSFAQSCG